MSSGILCEKGESNLYFFFFQPPHKRDMGDTEDRGGVGGENSDV